MASLAACSVEFGGESPFPAEEEGGGICIGVTLWLQDSANALRFAAFIPLPSGLARGDKPHKTLLFTICYPVSYGRSQATIRPRPISLFASSNCVVR